MMYSEYLAMTDRFSWYWPNHGKGLIDKPVYSAYVFKACENLPWSHSYCERKPTTRQVINYAIMEIINISL